MTREHQALAEWLGTLGLGTFCTMTFGKAWPDGPTRDAVGYHAQRFLVEHRIDRAFVVAERGESGQRRWHAHGLISNASSLPDADWRGVLWRDWRKRYGRSEFVEVERIGGVAGYVSKYVTKAHLPSDWWVAAKGRFS